MAVLLSTGAHAQKQDKAIQAVINRFFDAMASGDTVLLKSTCTEAPLLQTFMADREGNMRVITEDFQDFVRLIGKPREDRYLEKIKFRGIHVEQSLASVWTPYKFYLNGQLLHCGTNSFQLVKTVEGWKIQYIIDTRRRTGCD